MTAIRFRSQRDMTSFVCFVCLLNPADDIPHLEVRAV
jgi:hypothetical protein